MGMPSRSKEGCFDLRLATAFDVAGEREGQQRAIRRWPWGEGHFVTRAGSM